MNNADHGPQPTLFPQKAGERLRAVREERGLSLAEVGTRTRVPLRHLEAIEQSDYSALPSSTYAVGFAKAYARAVGADEVEIARLVRNEVSNSGRRQPEYEPYVMADPARLPSRGVAIVAAGIALALIVLGALWFGGSYWQHRSQPTGAPPPEAWSVTVPVTSQPVPAARGAQVRLTAKDDVWLRVYDAANKTLYLGTLKPGEGYDVPAGADHPMIQVGRADKLDVTLDGRSVPALGTGEHAIKDVAVDGAAIAARLGAGPAPGVSPTPTSSASPDATPGATSSATPTSPAASGTRDAARPRRSSHETATQRANRLSARAAQRGVAPPVPSGTATPAAAATQTP